LEPLAVLEDSPTVELRSGVRIANFSSPHPFRFNTGEELGACSKERANALMLSSTEEESKNPGGWTDIHLSWGMTSAVLSALNRECSREDVDIVLVPFPVMTALKDSGDWEDPLYRTKVRVCRMADRVTKVLFSDRFCA